MILGFIGTGAIAKALVTGLCTANARPGKIWLSPRNEAIAAEMAGRFANVQVAASNQDVLDRSETMILSVRPQVAIGILRGLRFRADHHVISVIATYSHAMLAPLVTPATSIVRAAPLPSVAVHLGPTPIHPPDRIAEDLFARTGIPVPVESQAAFNALFAATAEMASFFALLDACADWLTRNAVAEAAARNYLSAMFFSLADTARRTPDKPFRDLIDEHMTRGGLNEQLRREVGADGVFTSHARALDRVLSRIEGR